MDREKNSFNIDLSQIHTSNEDTPMSAKSLPSKSRRISTPDTARSDRPRPATGRDRWRKVADTMAPKTANAKLTKGVVPSLTPRRRSRAESLIVLFLARKRSLDKDAENGFEDTEPPGTEANVARRQSKEQVVSINLAEVYLSDSQHDFDASPNRPHDGAVPGVAVPTSPDGVSHADDIKQNKPDDPGENVAVAVTRPSDGASVCHRSAQTAPQVTTVHGSFFIGTVPAKGRRRGDSLNLEHAIHVRGFSCHDRALRDAGYVPRLDGSNRHNLNWVKEREPTSSSAVSAPESHTTRATETVKPSTALHGKKKPHKSMANQEKAATKAKHVRPRSTYEKLLHYLTLVRDYPEAFEKLRQLAANESTSRHLVRLGRVFTTGHFESCRRESPVQIAAYELGSRQRVISCAAPSKETMSSLPLPLPPAHSTLGKHAKLRFHTAMIAETDPSEATCQPDAKRILAQHGAVVAGLWRAREDAEKALASVNTYQSHQETEKALEELGEAEGSQQQWWLSQKDCRYLRNRDTMDVSC